MATFLVNEIVDGDTFKVKGGWTWSGRTGYDIRPTGYNTPERNEYGYQQAKDKLAQLILNQQIDIRDVKIIDEWGRLVADVYYNSQNLAEYFSEYKV